jgi:hypothetical protein
MIPNKHDVVKLYTVDCKEVLIPYDPNISTCQLRR